MAELARGTRVGNYVVQEPLGRGGMGVVYRATDTILGRDVALKVLAPSALADLDALERSAREAEAAASISNPGVVTLHSVGVHAGSPYLVFELLVGGSLADLVKKRGRLPWREAAALGARVARSLAALHDRGVVHRDLKPANVLLDEAGHPKIADLGLAWSFDIAKRGSLTATGEIVGTPLFVSPEQIESRRATGASDLYALGGTLHVLLTGLPPFQASGLSLLEKHLRAAPAPPSKLAPDVPPALDALVLRLLAKRPEDRPADARAVAAELEALAASAPAGRRGPLVAVGAVGLVAVAAAALVLATSGPRATSSVSPPGPAPVVSTTPSPRTPPSPPPSPPPSSAVATITSFNIERHRGARKGRTVARATSIAHAGPDRLAFGLENGRVEIWRLRSGTFLRYLGSKGPRIAGVGYSPAEKEVLAGDEDGAVRAFAADGTAVRTLVASGELGQLHRLVVSVNGEWVLTAGSTGVHYFSTKDPATRRRLSTATDVYALAISPFGDTVAYGRESGDVAFLGASGDVLKITKELAPVRAVAISLDGHSVDWAIDPPGPVARPLRLELFEVGNALPRPPCEIGRGVTAITPYTGSRVWVGLRGGYVEQWDAHTGQKLKDHPRHAADVTAIAVHARAGVVTAAKDQTFRVWNPDGTELLCEAESESGPVTALAVAPDGDRVAAADTFLGLTLWDQDRTFRYAAPPSRNIGRTNVYSVAFSPDGTHVGALVATENSWSRFVSFDAGGVDVASDVLGRPRFTRLAVSATDISPSVLEAPRDALAVATSEPSGRALFAFEDGHVELRDQRRRASLGTFATGKPWKTSPPVLALSPDGTRAIVGTARTSTFSVWDLRREVWRSVLEVDIEAVTADEVTAAAFRTDEYVLLGSARGMIYEGRLR